MVALALSGAVASDAVAGWRSADRRALEDDEVVEEPCERDTPCEWQGDGGHGDWHAHDGHDGRRHHQRDHGFHDGAPFVGTQPYWGQMRPYWNAGEPPGVIHRQPRTEPLRVKPAR